MSKFRKKIDPNQKTFDFNFNKKVDRYIESKKDILEAIESDPPVLPIENEFEACIEIAAAIKKAIRSTGMSRDQVVDKINDYFGRTVKGSANEPQSCRKPLSLHMLNNYLSKPTEYPIPAYYLYPIHHITRSLEPAATIVAAQGARIATGIELRQMTLGKLEENIKEMKKLKRDLGKR